MRKKNSFLLMINLTVVGIVSAVIVFLSILFFYYLYSVNNKSAMDTLNKDMSQIDQELTNIIENLYNVTGQLASDVQLGQATEDFYSDNIEDTVQGKKMMDYILNNAMAMNSSIENITLCSRKSILQYNNYSLDKKNNMERTVNQEWYKKLLKDEVTWVFDKNSLYTNKLDCGQYFFCATKFKNKFYQNRTEEDRIVIVTFQMSSLEKLMRNTAKFKDLNLVLFNGKTRDVIYNIGTGVLYKKITEDWIKTGITDMGNYRKNFIILNSTNHLTNWQLQGFVEQSVYQKMIYPIQTWLVLVISLVLVVSISMSIIIFRNISKPLKNVVQGMEAVGKQDFYKIQDIGKYREIDQLVTTFNQMSHRIQELIVNIALKEREKRKEEFRVLESQINPHFIYNTLEAIRWVAIMNNSQSTADAIKSFVKFLRISLSEGQELITVKQEIELTEEYIRIMVFRNNYNVEFSYEIEEQVKGLYTLKMVLQPLIENCFIHAFDKEQRHSKIRIRCYIGEKEIYSGDKYMIMEVEDNGRGMDYKKIVELDNPLVTGIGIHNIDGRIKIWHGKEYGLTVENRVGGGGTTVKISQPVMLERRER